MPHIPVQRTGTRELRRRERRGSHQNLRELSPSSEVDADPAAQALRIQPVRQMPRSRKNRYLLWSSEKVPRRAADALDPADDRDNFRDNQGQIASPVTCTLAYT